VTDPAKPADSGPADQIAEPEVDEDDDYDELLEDEEFYDENGEMYDIDAAGAIIEALEAEAEEFGEEDYDGEDDDITDSSEDEEDGDATGQMEEGN
jgi:hypothetical protein